MKLVRFWVTSTLNCSQFSMDPGVVHKTIREFSALNVYKRRLPEYRTSGKAGSTNLRADDPTFKTLFNFQVRDENNNCLANRLRNDPIIHVVCHYCDIESRNRTYNIYDRDHLQSNSLTVPASKGYFTADPSNRLPNVSCKVRTYHFATHLKIPLARKCC